MDLGMQKGIIAIYRRTTVYSYLPLFSILFAFEHLLIRVCIIRCPFRGLQIDIWKEIDCEWFERINEPTEPIFFMCPADAFMAGLKSVYLSSDRV